MKTVSLSLFFLVALFTQALSQQPCNYTIGNENPGFTDLGSFGEDFLLGLKFNVPVGGTLTALNLFGLGTNDSVQMALYTDNANTPDNLLVFSVKGVVTNGVVSLSVPSTYINPGDYWIMAVYDTTAVHTYQVTSGTKDVYYQALTFGSPLPSSANGFLSYCCRDFQYWMTFSNNTFGTDTQFACDSLSWIDGNTYYSNNDTAMFVLPNSVGCDSIITLDLTISNGTSSTDFHTACDSFIWMDGNTYTSSNNTETFILPNAVGCDSVITLDLTINKSTSFTDSQAACDSFVWLDGNTYTSSNNTATYMLTNAVGCDSMITLDLTLTNIDTSVSQNAAVLTADQTGATYQWLNCDSSHIAIPNATSQSFAPTINGTYAVEISQNGCVDTSDCFSITTVSIDKDHLGNQVKVYPNPTNGNFSVDLRTNFHEVKISITDLRGKIIQSQMYKNSQFLNLNLDEPKGVYLLSIEAGERKEVIRLLKR